MAKFQLNRLIKSQQKRTLSMAIIGTLILFTIVMVLAKNDKKQIKPKSNSHPINLVGVVDESFSDANTESALSQQQTELESLKTQIRQLAVSLEKSNQMQKDAIQQLTTKIEETKVAATEHAKSLPWARANPVVPVRVNSLSFRYAKKHANSPSARLNSESYVPSGTFVSAVVLGGADADASVNGQSKNNGVMLFKLLQPGTLPNGQHSHLQGCFVTASSYGDISSERAFVVLDKLSCVIPGHPIIDKSVTGWAFFGGKVGIKGIPLMRDNKIMQWAGISGALSGIASAAQYSQSIQSISPLGNSTTVPGSNIAPYAAYGGASKAAEVLSNYYVKRAEQYHPVIQVGSGNLVTIVFKEGFYLEPDKALLEKSEKHIDEEPDFEVPPQVLSKIDKTYTEQGVEP
jgi:conjugal transfer pilus assembly protein TraB